MVKIIDREYLPFIWPSISKYIDKALDKAAGEMCLEDVYMHIDEETYLLLVPFDEEEPIGAITLDIKNFERKTKLGIIHCGGIEIHKWVQETWGMIKFIAKNNDVDCISLTGRAGWLKMIPDKESRKYTILEYDV